MNQFNTAGGKIVRHLFPNLEAYYFGENVNEPTVFKGEFEKAKSKAPIVLIKNFKDELKISRSQSFGSIVLSFDEIIAIAQTEIDSDKPNLNHLISTLDDTISKLNA